MAVLTAGVRKKVWAGLMRFEDFKADGMSFSKHDLYNPSVNTGAIVDADVWIDSNEGNTSTNTGFNSELPTLIKTQLTASQKTLMFSAVAMARRSEATLKEWLGDIEA